MPSNTETLKIKARDETRTAFNSVKKNVSGLDRAAKRATAGLGGLAGGAVLVGLGNIAKKSINAADAVEKLSRRTGGSAQFLSEMRFALSQNDASLSDFENSLRKINKSAQDAADGLSTPTRAFQKLGIDVEAFNNLNTDEKFIQLSEAISKVDDPAIRAQTAMDIMGRSGTQLLTVMDGGAEGIKRYREEAEAMGLSLSTAQVQGAAAANDAIDKLTSSIGGSITQAIIPYTESIVQAADFTREYLPRAVEFLVDVFRSLKVVFLGVVEGIQTGIAALFEQAARLPLVGDKFSGVAESMRAAADDTRISLLDTVDNMGKWKESSEKAATAATDTASTIKTDFIPAINDGSSAIVGSTALTKKAADAAQALADKKKIEAEAVKVANEALRAAEEEARRYAEATGQNLIRTQDEINQVLDESAQHSKNYAAALATAEQVITSRGLIRGTDEFNQALEDLGFTINEVEDKTKEGTANIERLWQESTGAVSNVLGDFFTTGKADFNGFFDSILGSLGGFLNSFISNIVDSGIKSIFGDLFGGGDGDSGGGFLSGLIPDLGNLFGGGEGGFSIPGLGGIGDALSGLVPSFSGISKAVSGLLPGLSKLGPTLLGIAGPVGIATAAFFGLRELFGGGARSFEEIIEQDYLPDLLGQNVPNEAVGANGGIGFDGGNTAIFGTNFGIQGTGITNQLLNNGENGTVGFFNGAQENLEQLAELFRANNIEAEIAHGTLRALSRDGSQTTDDFIRLWEEYGNGLTEAVAHNAVLQTSFENDLIRSSNLFFENIALGFGQNAFEARESLVQIDSEFDRFVASGISSTDALFQSISEHYDISIADAQRFVNESGVSVDQWVQNFTDASGENLRTLLDFNADGITAFESLTEAGATASQNIAAGFRGDLTNILNTIPVGQLNVPDVQFTATGNITPTQTQADQPEAPFLGNFSTGGSFTVPNTGRGAGDNPFIIGLKQGEQVQIDAVDDPATNGNNDVAMMMYMVKSLASEVRQLTGEMKRKNNKENAFSNRT